MVLHVRKHPWFRWSRHHYGKGWDLYPNRDRWTCGLYTERLGVHRGSLVGNQLTLTSGQTASCSITNTAIAPTITVKKVLVPASGNTDTFNLQIDGATRTLSPVGDGGSDRPHRGFRRRVPYSR